MKEGERSNSALFITLTYDTQFVPITENGYMTLKKSDLQKFFKRLRKLSNERLKYNSIGTDFMTYPLKKDSVNRHDGVLKLPMANIPVHAGDHIVLADVQENRIDPPNIS